MTRTSAITHLSVPGWGVPGSASPGVGLRRAGGEQRRRLSWSRPGEIAAGALLVIVWAMLWGFFIAGVVEPAAGMQARADRPQVDVATGLPAARSGGGPGPVDTTGTAP